MYRRFTARGAWLWDAHGPSQRASWTSARNLSMLALVRRTIRVAERKPFRIRLLPKAGRVRAGGVRYAARALPGSPMFRKEFETKEVNFDVGGVKVVGTLRIPDSARPLPALAFTGPLTSVKEQVTGNYAIAMAERGYMTLSFDHRHFGESGGEPRQYEYPKRKVEDLRAALGYLAHRTEVNPQRVGAVGIGAGAGYVAGAVAADDRVRAWGAVAGFFHDLQKQKEWMGDRYEAEVERARRARDHYEETGEAATIPAVGEGDVAMPLPEALSYYGTARGAVPNYVNEFALMSREHTLPWDAQSFAPRINVPTLMIHSENAFSPDLARSFFAALGGDKTEVWLESKGQIDFYDDPELVEPAGDLLVKHFRAKM